MHDKKEKGDIGLTQIIALVTKQGGRVSLPLSEHLKYDMIVEKDGFACRIQVKYVTARKDKIAISIASSWANKSGNHRITREKGDFDILACYCPDTDECYFLADQEINASTSVTLSLKKKIKKHKVTRDAEDYKSYDRSFEVWRQSFIRNIDTVQKEYDTRALTKNKIFELKKTMGWNEIGYLYDVSGNTIRNIAKDFGLDVKQIGYNSNRSEYYDKVKHLHFEGLSQRQIAKELGCSRGNVEYIIKN